MTKWIKRNYKVILKRVRVKLIILRSSWTRSNHPVRKRRRYLCQRLQKAHSLQRCQIKTSMKRQWIYKIWHSKSWSNISKREITWTRSMKWSNIQHQGITCRHHLWRSSINRWKISFNRVEWLRKVLCFHQMNRIKTE